MSKPVSNIGDLIPDPRNARRHNPRNIGVISDGLQEVGFARSIVIDEDGVILAGNGVVEAAGSVGIEKVRVVDADGETIVAVRRSGLTQRQKARLSLLDNRASDLADFDPAILAAIQQEDATLLAGLWSDGEIEALLATGDPFGDTSTDRDGQGINSTWDQVKSTDQQRVVIGDLETRLPADVVDMLTNCLIRAYESDGTPIYETLAAVIIAGVRTVESGGD